MIPNKLQMHNFLSFKEPAPIDFSFFNLAVLSGDNGVGKSSVLEAITWAIWGQTRARSDDDLIHQGTTSCWVEFIFEHENSLYRIVRKRDKKSRSGQSFLEFQTKSSKNKNLISDIHWESIAEGTLKTTQEKIIRILKIPYEIFINSSYLRQGHADEFTTKTPSERKDILSDVLELNYYEDISQKAREKLRLSQEKIKLINFQIEDLQANLSRKKDVNANLKIFLDQYNTEHSKGQKIKSEINQLEIKQQQYQLAKERINVLLNRYNDIKVESDNLTSEYNELLSERNSILNKTKKSKLILSNFNNLVRLEKLLIVENLKYKKYSELMQELKVVQHIQNEVNNNIDRINKISNCPMCLRPMSKGDSNKISHNLKSEFKNKHQEKLINLLKSLKDLDYNASRHEYIQSEINKLSSAREEKQMLDLSENNLNNISLNLQKIATNNNKLKKEAQNISVEGKHQKEELKKLESVNASYLEKKQLAEEINNKILELKGSIGGMRQEIEHIKKQEESLKILNKDILAIQKDISNYEELSIAFGKKGIQAMIIEQSLSIIEEGANELLKKITSDRMTLKFITQKEKKSGNLDDNLVETLEIKISDELGSRDYEMYSGGEAFRINFAIRIALSKLLASRAGTHLKFLAIDEGFGMLDSAGRDDLIAAINSISPDFEKILVITHLQELKDLFPTKIEITKDSNGSHLEVINS